MGEKYYKIRMVKNGPWVPARVYYSCACTVNGGDDNRVHAYDPTCDRNPVLACEIGGRDVAYTFFASRQGFYESINKEMFDYMMDLKNWAEQEKWPPEARSNEAVDIDKIPVTI